jgi:ComF family protein
MMRLVDSLLEGLFPRHCCLCGLAAPGEHSLCGPCAAELEPNRHACVRCALPLPPGEFGPRPCGRCLRHPPAFERVIAPWRYSDQLGHLIHRWKYGGDTGLTGLLAHLWLGAAAGAGAVDLLVPVPLHWRKQWQRGFNQSELLARRLARLRPGLAADGVDVHLARRARPTAPQSGMDAARRRQNLRGAFTTRRSCASLRLAIIDDVLTTGTTADTLARTLLAAGASRVEVWCLARTPAPGS